MIVNTGAPAVGLSNLGEFLANLVNQTLPLTSTDGVTYSWYSSYGIYAGTLASVIWPYTSTSTTPRIATTCYQPELPPLYANIVTKSGGALTMGQLVSGTAGLLLYDGTNWRVLV